MSKRILLVEDDPDFAESLSLLLQINGYNVTVARSGVEALASHSADLFNVVLMDIRLPDISGVEVLKKLVAQDPKVRVFLMTGCGRTTTEVEEARQNGPQGIIYKPFRINDLLSILKDNI